MKNFIDLIKKNLAIAICVVVAIAAVAADFVPLGGFREELRTDAEGRAAQYATLDELMKKQRTLPIVDPGSTEAQPLDGFPTRTVIDKGKAAADELVKVSANLIDAVASINEKKPLEPGSLPNPQFVQADRFLQAYRRAVDMSTPGRNNSIPVVMMRAGFAPTSEDVQRASDDVRTRVQNTTAVVQDGQVRNLELVNATIAAELVSLQETIVREAAEKCMVYMNTDTMDLQPQLLNANAQPEPSLIFWAQMQLWAQEDLFKAIADTNTAAGAKNVGESPIKHLLKVQVPVRFIGIGEASIDPNNPAPPPSTDPNAPIALNYLKSPSGRVSNGLFDVLHMDVAMVVEADRLPEVLNRIGAGRLLSVIQVRKVEPIDPTIAANAGYFYGSKPCVRVDLLVENLMLRRWTEQYMPEVIKKMLGIVPAAAAPPA